MKIGMIGTGYVGLITGAGFADLGNNVIGLDIDPKKIEQLIKGKSLISEPGLEELIARNMREERLTFTTDYSHTVANSDMLFIAVGTPDRPDGSANTDFVFDAAREIARHMDRYKTIVIKSTVPPLTCKNVKEEMTSILKGHIDFDIVSNPEFLKEGEAVNDFKNPDRTIVGCESKRAEDIMRKLYDPLIRTGKPIIITNLATSELTKIASNSFIATKISFMNEFANLAEGINERIGNSADSVDILEISKGMGYDPRIGSRFLHPGTGFGGSCLPKDLLGAIELGKEYGVPMKIVKSAKEVNDHQRVSLLPKIESLVGLEGAVIAILGLSFKPKTDDVREAPSLYLIPELIKQGAIIRAYDHVAIANARKILGNKNITYHNHPFEALTGADVGVIMTEWDEFRSIDLNDVKQIMKHPNIVDGRDIYNPNDLEVLGINYIPVGRRFIIKK